MDSKINPAANTRRMGFSLALLAAVALLAWFTLDADAVLNVKGISNRFFSTGDFVVKVRWIPILFLSLFAVRIYLANLRARLDNKVE